MFLFLFNKTITPTLKQNVAVNVAIHFTIKIFSCSAAPVVGMANEITSNTRARITLHY